MSKLHFFTIILIYSYSLLGQESFILSGYVTDIETNEKLIGVNVLLPELNIQKYIFLCFILQFKLEIGQI